MFSMLARYSNFRRALAGGYFNDLLRTAAGIGLILCGERIPDSALTRSMSEY